MPAMERLIWVTWRAFWVGLGASLVLIAQAFAPARAMQTPNAEAKVDTAFTTGAGSSGGQACPGVTGTKSADPILSRNPFDSKTGPLIATPSKRPRGV